MDGGEPSPTRRKLKFAPKAPPKRKPKPPASNSEAGDEQHEDSAQAQALLRRWNENVARREPKESKSNVQVAFGPGDNSSPPLRTYGVSKAVNRVKGSGGSASKEDFSNEQSALTRSSSAIEDKSDACVIYASEDTTKATAWKNKRDYKEPWDYHNSYYPTTLPLRKPYSGDPEILDAEEFGEAATSKEYDENTMNCAEELGLLKSEQHRMLFFKLPPALPLFKQSVSRKGKEKVGTSTISGGSTKGTPLEGLPQGYMGKMLVYKSGAIKLKLGETLFDVSPGSNAKFAQDAVAINTAQKHCCVLGELGKMAVVTPDLDNAEL